MLLWAEFLEKGYNMTNNGISLKSSNGSKKGKKGSEKRLKNSPEDNVWLESHQKQLAKAWQRTKNWAKRLKTDRKWLETTLRTP